jgi:hypothetical protein
VRLPGAGPQREHCGTNDMTEAPSAYQHLSRGDEFRNSVASSGLVPHLIPHCDLWNSRIGAYATALRARCIRYSERLWPVDIARKRLAGAHVRPDDSTCDIGL